jgi:hypothetical protein
MKTRMPLTLIMAGMWLAPVIAGNAAASPDAAPDRSDRKPSDTAEAGRNAVPLELNTAVDLDGRRVILTKLDSLPYVESDYTKRFRFDSFDNPKLVEMRERYKLNEVIAPGKDEFEEQILLMDWTHRQFRKFGRPSAKANGALEILKAIDDGHSFFCAQYAEVLVSAAASLGWLDRPLALRRHKGANKTGGSTEHSVTEIWSNQHRKWVMLDPTANMHVEKDGVPLNAFEIRQEWFYSDGKELTFVAGSERKKYRKSDLPIIVGRFEGFGDLTVDPDEPDKYGFIGYIPNTDLMDAGYDYGKMFIVKDALCDGTKWHLRTLPAHPATDPYFPVNQAALTLVAENGKIAASLKTLTPNFKRFEVRIDGGRWQPSGETFAWNVHPGSNRLEARSVNAFGVSGPVSTAELMVKE